MAINEGRSVHVLIVTPPLFLFETSLICWWCVDPITVVGIVARRVAVLQHGDETPCGEDADGYFLLTYVESLPESLLAEIQMQAPTFSLSGWTTAKRPCFANLCAYCNAVQSDALIFSESGFPADEDDIDSNHLRSLSFAEPFQTYAVGASFSLAQLRQSHFDPPGDGGSSPHQ